MTELRGQALRVTDGVLYIRDDDGDEIEMHLLPGLAPLIPHIEKLLGRRICFFYDEQGANVAPIKDNEPLGLFHSHSKGNSMISHTTLKYLARRGNMEQTQISFPKD